jgi:hypothetical protein
MFLAFSAQTSLRLRSIGGVDVAKIQPHLFSVGISIAPVSV